VPHAEQNRPLAGSSAPQEWQTAAMEAPHEAQKRAPPVVALPQLGQVAISGVYCLGGTHRR
jgi:hypothetical protein